MSCGAVRRSDAACLDTLMVIIVRQTNKLHVVGFDALVNAVFVVWRRVVGRLGVSTLSWV